MSRAPAAYALWADIYLALDDDVHGLYGAAIARAEAHMLRLQVVYALIDGIDTIDVPHVQAAAAVWDYADNTARVLFGGTRTGDVNADQLLDALEAARSGLTRTQQSEVFVRNLTADDLARTRRVLIDKNLATEKVITTRGDPCTFCTGYERTKIRIMAPPMSTPPSPTGTPRIESTATSPAMKEAMNYPHPIARAAIAYITAFEDGPTPDPETLEVLHDIWLDVDDHELFALAIANIAGGFAYSTRDDRLEVLGRCAAVVETPMA